MRHKKDGVENNANWIPYQLFLSEVRVFFGESSYGPQSGVLHMQRQCMPLRDTSGSMRQKACASTPSTIRLLSACTICRDNWSQGRLCYLTQTSSAPRSRSSTCATRGVATQSNTPGVIHTDRIAPVPRASRWLLLVRQQSPTWHKRQTA